MNQKGFSYIIIIGGLLLLIGIFLTLYQTKIPRQSSISTKPRISPQQQSTPIVLDEDKTTNITTLRSPKHGFEIKYNSNIFKLEETADSLYLSTSEPKIEDSDYQAGLSVKINSGLLKDTTLKQFVDKEFKSYIENGVEIVSPTPIEINNIKGYTFTIGGIGKFKSIYFPRNDGYISLVFSSSNLDNTENKKRLDELLANFKILE